FLRRRKPGARDGSPGRGALRGGRAGRQAGAGGGGARRPLHGHGADQPHQRPRSRDVRDGRRRHAIVGPCAADDGGDPALVSVHQARPPAAPPPSPAGRPRRPGWSGRVGADQPIDEHRLLGLLKRAAEEQGAQAWVVGGYVRDHLIGRLQPHLDVVVEQGGAQRLAERFAELASAAPPVIFERFGTAQVTLPGHLVEFVSARSSPYPPDSRKPDVRPATLEEDLRRRDFTVNTLLMDFDGNVHDRLGTARADLGARILRTPTDPVRTFEDDPLRMLRAVRFAAQAGFELAPDLLPAMRLLRGRLVAPVISVERTAEELRKMLLSERPRLALELLDEAGLLEVILPELAACKGVEQGG